MHLTTAQQRVVTGLVLLALVALLIFLGGWALRLAVALAAAAALLEFFNLYWPGTLLAGRKGLGLLLGTLVVLSQGVDPLWTLAVTCLALVSVCLLFLADYGRGNTEAKLGHYGPLLHGLLYIPFILQLALYLPPAEQCLALTAAMATDTGGYYAGTLYGRHKMWPLVSPKKSWEGFFGGMLLCVAVCMLLGLTAQAMDWRMIRLPFWGWALLGLALNLAALLGDFFESALKRSLNVKDSGALLPGHGGMLDRIDSLLFVLPVFMLLRLLVRILQGS